MTTTPAIASLIGDLAADEEEAPDEVPETPVDLAGGESSGSSLMAFATNGVMSTEFVGSGAAASGPVCSYELAESWAEPVAVNEPPNYPSLYRDMHTHEFVDGPGAGVEMWAYTRCPPDGPRRGSPRWIPTAPAVDVDALVAMAFERVAAVVPMPPLDLWPPAEHGAPVNLGLWMAVEDPGQVNVVAQVGPVWASVTARFSGTEWEMGNGDSFWCSGLGTPYPANLGRTADPYREGPCGYTYRTFDDVGFRRMTATASYDVQLITSTGRDEWLDPVSRSHSFSYEVYEIWTVLVAEPPSQQPAQPPS